MINPKKAVRDYLQGCLWSPPIAHRRSYSHSSLPPETSKPNCATRCTCLLRKVCKDTNPYESKLQQLTSLSKQNTHHSKPKARLTPSHAEQNMHHSKPKARLTPNHTEQNAHYSKPKTNLTPSHTELNMHPSKPNARLTPSHAEQNTLHAKPKTRLTPSHTEQNRHHSKPKTNLTSRHTEQNVHHSKPKTHLTPSQSEQNMHHSKPKTCLTPSHTDKNQTKHVISKEERAQRYISERRAMHKQIIVLGNYFFERSIENNLAIGSCYRMCEGVYKGYHIKDLSVPVAVKCITKEINKSKELLEKEIKVLRELSLLQHENVVSLLDVKATDTSVFLMIEFCNGGDLADYLQSKGTLSEDTLSSFTYQIASALNALNDKDVVHRDLKPQNILLCCPKGGNKLTTPPTQLTLKIADFGFARFLEDGKMAGTLCGSPMYMAPEVIMSHRYDSKADLWSVGTIIFQCLTGKAPFQANNPQQLRDFYQVNIDLKPKIPENTSPELRDMLLRLLTRDATKRIGIKELVEHPFLQKFRRSSSKRYHSSSPIPTHRRTPSLSSEGSTPGSNREISPLSRQKPEANMASTLTASIDEDFMKVEKPDTRPHTPEDFVLVPASLPEYHSSGEKKGRTVRAPLAQAEEEYDAFEESLTSSIQPVRLHSEDGRATFRRDDYHRRVPSPSAPRLSSPTSPSPPLTQRCGGSSAPIPVPSLSRVSSLTQQLQREGSGGKSGVSPARVKKRSSSIGGGDRFGERSTARRHSETALAAPDITQVSPPAVQFNIGTPPSTGTWKRTNSYGSCPNTTTASNTVAIGSPLRRSASCCPGTYFSPHPHPSCTAPSPLPPLAGSPTGHYPYPYPYPHPHYNHQHSPHDPYTIHDPKFHRYPTVPDCTALVAAYPCREEAGLEACHRCGTEPDLRSQPFHSNHILRTAFATHQHANTLPGLGALVGWSGSRERLTSLGSDKDRASPSSLEMEGSNPIVQRRNSLAVEPSPPSGLLFTASPPKFEPPIPIVPPELSEDTLMDDEHNQTMARLRFILDVVDCVVNLARSKGAAYNPMADSLALKSRPDTLPQVNTPSTKFSESQRILEQLVLYLRALQMMAQSISLAQKEMKQDRLQYVTSLKKVLNQQNELYLFCIDECRKLYEQLGAVCKTPLTPQLIVNTADKLIYNYAVEQCQSAALDELEGNKKECFHRYTTAQILLHSLAQMARNDHDKVLLEKYRRSVELRLSSIGGQQHPCQTCS